jgi:hypothetical protein
VEAVATCAEHSARVRERAEEGEACCCVLLTVVEGRIR